MVHCRLISILQFRSPHISEQPTTIKINRQLHCGLAVCSSGNADEPAAHPDIAQDVAGSDDFLGAHNAASDHACEVARLHARNEYIFVQFKHANDEDGSAMSSFCIAASSGDGTTYRISDSIIASSNCPAASEHVLEMITEVRAAIAKGNQWEFAAQKLKEGRLRTLQERIKFDHGLTINKQYLVGFNIGTR